MSPGNVYITLKGLKGISTPLVAILCLKMWLIWNKRALARYKRETRLSAHEMFYIIFVKI